MNILRKRTIIYLTSFIFFFFLSGNIYCQVIFSDNFDSFNNGWIPSKPAPGHAVTGGTSEKPGRNEPEGWTGYINHDARNYIAIVPNEGRNGSPCLKIGPSPGVSPWNQVGLVKWLGPKGYDDIYIRYYVKYDQKWRWGNGTNGSQGYQKWLRIWQNVKVTEVLGNTGNLSNESNRGYLIFTVTDDEWSDFSPFFNGTFSIDPALNSYTPPLMRMYYYPWNDSEISGFIENHFGNIDENGYWEETQTWHCIEVHFKLAKSLEIDDGVFEIWVDGIKQKKPTRIVISDGYSNKNMATMKLGSGINYIGFHDNGTGNGYWTDYNYVWIDDIVISTKYIGPNTTPIGGFNEANYIPINEVKQKIDGSGDVIINFKVLDEVENTPITLCNFQYKIANGIWISPIGGDSSHAFSKNWSDNGYLSGKYEVFGGSYQEWNLAQSYSFIINIKHSDFYHLNSLEDYVQFRFYVKNFNSIKSIEPVTIAPILLDTFAPISPIGIQVY